MDETFLLSNIAPQVGAGFNRHCPSANSLFPHDPSLCSLLLQPRRLGLSRKLVSPADELVLRCLRVHHSVVPSPQRARREVAGRTFGTHNPNFLKLIIFP